MSEPSPPYKGLMMLKVAASAYGWNENVWLNRPNFAASLAALQERAARRLALSTPAVRVVGLRVTNPRLLRASAFDTFDRSGAYQSARPTHLPWVLLLLRLCNNQGYHTRYNLGGVPKDVANIQGVHPPEAWQAAFHECAEALKRHCVMVNRRHAPREAAAGEAPREAVVNAIEEVSIGGVTTRKRGMGHSYPRARRRRRG